MCVTHQVQRDFYTSEMRELRSLITFTLVTMVPDRIISWAGQLVASLGDFHAEAVMQQGKASMDATAGRVLPSIAAGSAIGAVAGIGAGRARRKNEALIRELSQGSRKV